MAGTIRDLSFSDGVEISQPTDAPGSIGSIKTAIADYTFLDGDGYSHVLMTSGATDRVVTLPTAADNSGRVFVVKKVDSGAGKVTLKSEAAGETIDGVSGTTGIEMLLINDDLTVISDGTDFFVTSYNRTLAKAYAQASTAESLGTSSNETVDFNNVIIDTHSAVTTGAAWVFTAPRTGYYHISARILLAATAFATTEFFFTRLKNHADGDISNGDRVYGNGASILLDSSLSSVALITEGETIRMKANQNSGGTVLSETGANVYISITEQE